MENIYEDLSWLPKPPVDFNQKLLTASTGLHLRDLAKFAINDNQLRKLSKKVADFQYRDVDLNPLTPLSVGILSNSNTQLVVDSLVGTALRFGISLKVVEAEFNQVAQEAFSSESIFSSGGLSAILVALDYRSLPFSPSPGDEVLAMDNLERCLQYIESIVSSIKKKSGAQIILQNIAAPGEGILGSFERRLPGTLLWLCAQLNLRLDALATEDIFILDVAGLASNIGLANWHDPVQWNMAKLAFSQRYAPVYADYVCRILGARLGKSRRCLILDLDNTLWGGVIGDDGLQGILIGNGNPVGEAHLEIQKIALELRNRGIVLAVSSKNDDVTARQPFLKHPDMLLRENHIAVFQANWGDKASNIRTIAKALSLGLESMVFLDDNPAERMLVRSELPEVAVPELPEDPAQFARVLIAAGYFEAIRFSDEDKKRANFYQDNASRALILSQSSDMESYLTSLRMEITLSPFDIQGRARISQLISKSNQFNLTTKRYCEVDIEAMEVDSSFYTRQIRLKDILGDNGMISVVICKINSIFWEIDTWLMSCRVLGRRVEEAVLLDIVESAKEAGAIKLRGLFYPTGRNEIVRDHYKNLGFKKISEEEGRQIWELNLSEYQPPSLPINFIHAF